MRPTAATLIVPAFTLLLVAGGGTAMAQTIVGQTTTGPMAAMETAGTAQPLPSGYSNREIAPGTRDDFDANPPAASQGLFTIGTVPVVARAPVMPPYNDAGTYSTVAGQPASGTNGMSAQLMADGPQGQDVDASMISP